MAIEKIPLSARCPQVARPGSADSRPGAATHHERGRLPSRSSQKPTASLVKSLGITVGHLSGRNSSVRFVECTHAAPCRPIRSVQAIASEDGYCSAEAQHRPTPARGL
jgi:hypothetical protein